MNTPQHTKNDIRYAARRHPVDFLEPIDDSIDRICEVLRGTFGWVAEGARPPSKKDSVLRSFSIAFAPI